MDIEWLLQRRRTTATWTSGDLDCAGRYNCRTLEDELREHKLAGETAIPAGRYELEFVKSPNFGDDTIALLDVAGFTDILMHSGNTEIDTKGCIIVGDLLDEVTGRISGGTARKVLARLKNELRREFDAGNRVFLTVKNAPGDRFVDTGNPASVA